jgi:hypothetical protein
VSASISASVGFGLPKRLRASTIRAVSRKLGNNRGVK